MRRKNQEKMFVWIQITSRSLKPVSAVLVAIERPVDILIDRDDSLLDDIFQIRNKTLLCSRIFLLNLKSVPLNSTECISSSFCLKCLNLVTIGLGLHPLLSSQAVDTMEADGFYCVLQ